MTIYGLEIAVPLIGGFSHFPPNHQKMLQQNNFSKIKIYVYKFKVSDMYNFVVHNWYI